MEPCLRAWVASALTHIGSILYDAVPIKAENYFLTLQMCAFATSYGMEREYGVKAYVMPDQLEMLAEMFESEQFNRWGTFWIQAGTVCKAFDYTIL